MAETENKNQFVSIEEYNKLNDKLDKFLDLFSKSKESQIQQTQQPQLQLPLQSPAPAQLNNDDAYLLAKREQENKEAIKQEAIKQVNYENWIKNFKNNYNTVNANDIDTILNLQNQTVDYKATKLIEESFKQSNLLDALDSQSKREVEQYLNSSIENKISKAKDMTTYLDKAIELDTKFKLSNNITNDNIISKSNDWLELTIDYNNSLNK